MNATLKKLVLVLVMLVVSVAARAADFIVGGIAYEVRSDEDLTCAVVSHPDQYSGDVVIPASVTYNDQTYAVVEIADNCFESNSEVTSVTIPNSVTSLGISCFSSCGITSVSLPNSITGLPDECFYNCTNLTAIEIPNSVTSLGNRCFYSCSNLTGLRIPDGVTHLPSNCFEGCTGLITVEMPNTVTYLGWMCFRDCKSLTNIDLSDALTVILNYCFDGCSSLTSIEIPASVTSLSPSCFSNCSSLTTIDLPPSLTSLEQSCFLNCSNLKSIELPASLQHIEGYCFEYCSSLTSVIIPDGVLDIGDFCFCGCENLESISLSKSLTSLGFMCFILCPNLKYIEIPVNVRSIAQSCFLGCEGIEEVKIMSDYIPYHGESVFSGCRNIKTAYVNCDIWSGMFSDSNQLGELTLGPGTKSIESNEGSPFAENAIKTIIVEDGDVTIDADGEITWSRSVESMYLGRGFEGADMNCESLRELTLGEQLQSLSLGDATRSLSDLPVLGKLTSLNPEPPEIGMPTETQFATIEVEVPAESLEAYKNDAVWSRFVSLKGGQSGIRAVENTGADIVARFDMAGRPVDQSYKGLVVVRYSDGRVMKAVQ